MTKQTIVIDPGSCHMGKWDYIKELTDVVKESGADIIKWQLFKGYGNGNIEFPRQLFPSAIEYAQNIGLDVFASVFDVEAIELLKDSNINKIKLSYSNNFNLELIKEAKKNDMAIWASGDINYYPYYADVKFLCRPQYPPKNKIFIDDDDIVKYDGFSSHYLGYKVDLDIMTYKTYSMIEQRQFQYLEKHLTLDHPDIDCPDNYFALTPKELKEMVKCLRSA